MEDCHKLAYMRERRAAWLASGLCSSCGKIPADTGQKCADCRADECRRARDGRRYARIGKKVLPTLRKGVGSGQGA